MKSGYKLFLFIIFLTCINLSTNAQEIEDEHMITSSNQYIYISDISLPLIKVFDINTGELVKGIALDKKAQLIQISTGFDKLFVVDDQYAFYIDLEDDDMAKNKYALHPGGQFEDEYGDMEDYSENIGIHSLLPNGYLDYSDYSQDESDQQYNIVTKATTVVNDEELSEIRTSEMTYSIRQYNYDSKTKFIKPEPNPFPEYPDSPDRNDYKKNKDYKLAEEKYRADVKHYENVLMPEYNKRHDEFETIVLYDITISDFYTGEVLVSREDVTGYDFFMENTNVILVMDDYTYSFYDLFRGGELLFAIDRL